MELIHKALDFEVRQAGEAQDRTLEFVGSTADVDRYGDIIEVAGWDLKNFQKNPVILWAHNYSLPPVGTARKVTKSDNGLIFQVYFPTDEEINAAGWPDNMPTPETVYRLCLAGVLRTTSVGFRGVDAEPILGEEDNSGYRPRLGTRYLKQELYELSIVPVPANPFAVIQDAVRKGIIPESQARFFEAPEDRGAIPYKKYPTADPDTAWDGPAQIKASDVDGLKIICTWFDAAKPNDKGSYKLPHHLAENKDVVWKGVTAAMAALLGAQGGVDIPDGDRKGVYNHLAKHYNQFDKEPPAFKSYSAAELRLIELGLPPTPEEIDKMACVKNLKVRHPDPGAGNGPAHPCTSCADADGCCCSTCANNQPGVCCCQNCEEADTCSCKPNDGSCDTCPLNQSDEGLACGVCSLTGTCSCNSCDRGSVCHCSPCSPTTPPQRAAGGQERHPHPGSPCDKCPMTATCACRGCDQIADCHCAPCTAAATKGATPDNCQRGRYQARDGEVPGQARSGAVLSTKNKEKLQKAQAHIKEVLDEAEGGGSETGVSYYRTALNPGLEPHGVRPAEAEKETQKELLELTQNLHQTVCK